MTPLRRRRRFLRAGLALALGLLAAPLALELGLRWLIFGSGPVARRLGAGLRRAELYTVVEYEEDYWKLRRRFADPAQRQPPTHPDALLGWTKFQVEPGTYEHARSRDVRGRRPVLLYGDSFANGHVERWRKFESILERSDLADEYALVNYGVGGYGLDQIWLLLRESIDLWAAQDPIVIVGILVESDLDRMALAYRDWPKPRLRLEGGELMAAPVTTDEERYLREHPIAIRSYLARLVERRLLPGARRVRPTEDPERMAELEQLATRVLAETHRMLEERGLRHGVLAFHTLDGLRGLSGTWEEELVRRACRELGMPIVDTRPFLAAAAARAASARAGDEDPQDMARFYIPSGAPGVGHLNALGNAVVFEAIRQAVLGGDPGSVDPARIELALGADAFDRERPLALLGRTVVVHEVEPGPAVHLVPAGGEFRGDALPTERLYVRPGIKGPTQIRFDHDGSSRRLRAVAQLLTPTDVPCEPSTSWLTVRADGTSLLRAIVPRAPVTLPIELELGGVRKIVISYGTTATDPECEWLRLAQPRIE